MDNDQIRVDLLKFRRKAYNSYPVGSEERKNFLKILLENELRLTQQEVPKSLINFIVEGRDAVFWDTLRKSLPWFFTAIFSNVLFSILFAHHYRFIAFLFIILGFTSIATAARYFYEYFIYCQNTKEAQQYLNAMNKHMNKISNDIKQLEGPK